MTPRLIESNLKPYFIIFSSFFFLVARHFPGDPYRPSYSDYEHYPAYGNTQYGGGLGPGLGLSHPAYSDAGNYAEQSPYGDGLGDRPPTPPSPSERSDSPPPQQHGETRTPPRPACEPPFARQPAALIT